jgi:hypothetical protein
LWDPARSGRAGCPLLFYSTGVPFLLSVAPSAVLQLVSMPRRSGRPPLFSPASDGSVPPIRGRPADADVPPAGRRRRGGRVGRGRMGRPLDSLPVGGGSVRGSSAGFPSVQSSSFVGPPMSSVSLLGSSVSGNYLARFLCLCYHF